MQNKTLVKKAAKEAIIALRILIALMTLVAPIVFTWIEELVMEPRWGISLTNGYQDFDPIEHYHYYMYWMLACCTIGAYIQIRTLIK